MNGVYLCNRLNLPVIQFIFQASVKKAGKAKQVTAQGKRQLCHVPIAIGILENGTDIHYIQELLGHSSSRTTEVYTHEITRNIQNIVSPFDML